MCRCSYFNSRTMLTRKVKFRLKIPNKKWSRDSLGLLGVAISPKNRPVGRPRIPEGVY